MVSFCVLAIGFPALSARRSDTPPATARSPFNYVRTFARKALLRQGSPTLEIAGYAGEDYQAAKRLNPQPTTFRLFRRCRHW